MIPPFALPSSPETKITLREATVQDCIDFSGVDPAHEEEVTTLFLNRLQDKATFKDAKTWTGEDRRLGLFWYWIHTAKDTDVAISYDCAHCGEKHTYLQDYRELSSGHQSMKGLPEREIEHDGKKIIVKPLGGEALERIELMKISRSMLEGDDYRKQEARIKLAMVAETLPDDFDVLSMSESGFTELAEKIKAALQDMQHGLESEYDDGSIVLVLPPHQCLNKETDKEAVTRIRVNFRHLDYIPVL